jgi:hypothetical protein
MNTNARRASKPQGIQVFPVRKIANAQISSAETQMAQKELPGSKQKEEQGLR